MRGTAAWAWYAPRRVAMAVDEEGRFAVDLGDPEPADAADLEPAVALLARRVYHAAAPLAPADVYRYVTQGDHACDPWGAPLSPPAEGAAEGAAGGAEGEGAADDAAPADADAPPPCPRAIHLPTNLVQHLAGAPAAAHLGHPRATLRFATYDAALLATAVDARHRRATGRGVLRLLAAAAARLEDGADRLPTRLGPVLPALPPLTVARHLAPADADAPRPVLPSGAWAALQEAVGGVEEDDEGRDARERGRDEGRDARERGRDEGRDAGVAWRVPVVVAMGDDAGCVATVCTVVLRHWRRAADGGALVHRGLATCALRARPVALGGLCVELAVRDRAAAEAWPPWWVDAAARLLPRAAVADAAAVPAARRAPKRAWSAVVGEAAEAPERAAGPTASAAHLNAARQWRRAAADPSVRAPVLEAAVPLDLADDAGGATADGALVARRLTTEAAMRDLTDGAHGLIATGIGRDFADYVVEGALASRGRVGVYAVHARGRAAAIAAFSVVLFRCAGGDGGAGAALVVQSLAVADDAREGGVGGAVVRELCRPIAARRAARYAIFAQCVRTRAATRFWGQRLDDSAAARALVLQAVALEPAIIRLELQCTPRAREYHDHPPDGT